MTQPSPTSPAHNTATTNSPPSPTTTATSPKPPDYNTPSSPPPRRVRFHSPPPSLRSLADNESLLPSYTVAAKYGKFGSEAEYLTAMRAWAEDQMYMDPGDRGLVGFYGKKTIQDYINQPGGGWRSEPKEKRVKDVGGGAGAERERERRKGSLSKWLGRKRGESVMGEG